MNYRLLLLLGLTGALPASLAKTDANALSGSRVQTVERLSVANHLPEISKGTAHLDLLQFGKVLEAYGIDIDQNWHHLILLCVDSFVSNWIDKTMDAAMPWSEAYAKITKHIETAVPTLFVPEYLPTITKGAAALGMQKFENVLKAYGMDIDENWHRLIFLCVNSLVSNWIDKTLDPTIPWIEAQTKITEYIKETNVQIYESDAVPPLFVPEDLPTIMKGAAALGMQKFENVLEANNLDLDRDWHRLIVLCVDPRISIYVNKEFTHTIPWMEAKEKILSYIDVASRRKIWVTSTNSDERLGSPPS